MNIMPGKTKKFQENPIKFIDLFAGIGGIRLAFQGSGAECVFSSEWDKYAQITYEANFGEKPEGDIRKIEATSIPDFDILCAGFPCQPFSIAGVSKKLSLNKPHGFKDMTQGTLFYEILRILKEKKPSAYFLENVKNLESHDKGKTFKIIRTTLEDTGYSFNSRVINAKTLVPQNRDRIFIIGFRDRNIEFQFPEIPNNKPKIRDILEEFPDNKYTLTDHLWDYIQNYAEKHRKMGNGFGFGLVNPDSYCRTLSARYFKDGSEILIPQRSKNPRRLTPRECARIQGYPSNFKIPVSDTQAYKLFGNSVAVPLVEILAKQIIYTLREKPRSAKPALVQSRLTDQPFSSKAVSR
jgi:DNA (cytosine-5)-methyltransferase 1